MSKTTLCVRGENSVPPEREQLEVDLRGTWGAAAFSFFIWVLAPHIREIH